MRKGDLCIVHFVDPYKQFNLVVNLRVANDFLYQKLVLAALNLNYDAQEGISDKTPATAKRCSTVIKTFF